MAFRFPIKLFLIVLVLTISCPSFVFADHEETETNVSTDDLFAMSLEDLTKVEVVTATKKIQSISDAPSVVKVITARQIRERGYLTLEEALASLPGFQFRDILGFNSYVFQRGVPNQNNLILILVDGIQINELNSGGFYGGGQYNLDNVEQIEVVYGPSSALYGTNAISGIVNIITKEPYSHTGFEANALYGGFNTIKTELGYGYYNEDTDLGFRISGRLYQTEKADLVGEEGDYNWTDDMENFEDDLSLDARLNFQKYSAAITVIDKQASRATNYRSVDSKYIDHDTNLHIRFINSYLKSESEITGNAVFNSQLYYRNAEIMKNTVAYIDTNSQVGYYRPNDLFGYEGMINYDPIESLNLTGGFVYEKENLAEGFSKSYSNSPDQEPPEPDKPSMKSNTLMSLYFQSMHHWLDKYQLNAGLRFDNSSSYDQVLTPRFSIVSNWDKFKGKLIYAEAFRAPKPWDYTWGAGNDDLDPETMRSYEVVLSYNIQKNLQTEISFYRNTITDVLEKDSGLNMWVNGEDLITDGFELSCNYYLPRLELGINYTYTNSEHEDHGDIPEISDHVVNINSKYSFSPNLVFYLGGRYTGERMNPHLIPVTNDDIIDASFVLNSALTYYDFHGFDIQLIAKNVLDTEYYHSSNRSSASYSVSRFRQQQRTLMLSIYWKTGNK